jgi:hypothetical protein
MYKLYIYIHMCILQSIFISSFHTKYVVSVKVLGAETKKDQRNREKILFKISQEIALNRDKS